MTTVNGRLIGLDNPDRIEVTATLVDVTGDTVVGYVASVPGEVVRPQRIRPNATTGVWTVDLTPNGGIESDAGDTLWCITEGRALDGTPNNTYIVVPASGGPYWIGDIRADLSDTQTGQSTIVYLPGPEGPPGADGTDGQDGASAYEEWLAAGNTGTEIEFLASLVGPAGSPGAPGSAGADGEDGASAYELAVTGGFAGTQAEWLASLVGPQGEPGADAPARPGVLWHVTEQPEDSLGIDGDWALSLGERRIYGPKAEGAWEPWSRIEPPTAAGWQRNGQADLTGGDLYLTHASDGFGAGTCWTTATYPTDGLDVSFTVEMSGGTGADGVTFALADPATAATFVGGGGGELGLQGCTAAALALDTGAGSRARIVTTDADSMDAVATYGGVLDLRAAPVRVRVLYEDGAMSVWLGSLLLFDQVAVTAPATARVGWTGANGGANDDHIVRQVQFVAKGGIQL
jgi:hypothetical protein